jgi:hypothetical protein
MLDCIKKLKPNLKLYLDGEGVIEAALIRIGLWRGWIETGLVTGLAMVGPVLKQKKYFQEM